MNRTFLVHPGVAYFFCFVHCLLRQEGVVPLVVSTRQTGGGQMASRLGGHGQQSKVPMLMKFARTLLTHRSGILAYYDFRISSGPLQGFNNKIKTMKRQAYGFRNMAF